MAFLTLNQEQVSALVGSVEQFPVDFDAAWQWAGYTRKENAAIKLKAHFIEGLEFYMVACKTPEGGRPSVSYSLTNDCFKMFCMMAGTEKGKEVRRYYLDCEYQLKETAQQPQTSMPEIDWQAIAELRRQIESTPSGMLRSALEKQACDLLNQDYFALLSVQPPKPKVKKGDRTFSVPQQPAGISHMQSFLEHGAYIKKTDDPKDFVTTANLFAAYQAYLKDYPLLLESGQTPCLNLIGFGKRFSSAHGTPSVFKKMRNRKLKGHAGIALGELALID